MPRLTLLLPLICWTAAASEYHTSVTPLANEDILSPCQYELTILRPDRAIHSVWVMFDRGVDFVHFYENADVRKLAGRFQIALMLPRHCRSKEHEDMIVEPSQGIGRALFTALDQFASITGHTELASAGLIVMGWSGAGSLVARLPGYRPDRILASIDYAPGQYIPLGMDTIHLNDEAMRSPQLIIANGADKVCGTRQPYEFFRRHWERGAPWTFVIQNRTPHCCLQNAQTLILAWMEAWLVRGWKPRPGGPVGFIELEPTDLRDEWKAPMSNIHAAVVSDAKQSLSANQLPAGWLISRKFAREWRAFAQRADPPAVWKP